MVETEDVPPGSPPGKGAKVTRNVDYPTYLRAVEKAGARIVMPLKTQFYGMREFAFVDPQGWTVTMAERVK